MPTAPISANSGIIMIVKYSPASACLQMRWKFGSDVIATSDQWQDQLWIVAVTSEALMP